MVGPRAFLIPLLAAALQVSTAKVYFRERFDDGSWKERWTVPTKWKSEKELGEWGEKLMLDGEPASKGLQTTQNSRFYGIIAPLDEPFTQTGDLVLQLTVKHENRLDCGGAYIKLLGGDKVQPESFGGDTPYQIMFGPDICGPANARTHVIFHYPPKGENLLVKKDVKVEKDTLSHVYTLHVKQDATYTVYIDQQEVKAGSLEEDFAFLPSKEIEDPAQSKPTDWVEEKMIPDPAAVKPAGWDDVPATVPDAAAVQPEEWNEEEDGAWEPPQVANPDYKGSWKAHMIPNPAYKGKWEHPLVPNPEYKQDPLLYRRCDGCTHIGFELWQVTSGTIFDDILVTDSLEEAQALAAEGWGSWQQREKEALEQQQQQEQEKRAAELQQQQQQQQPLPDFTAGADEDEVEELDLRDEL